MFSIVRASCGTGSPASFLVQLKIQETLILVAAAHLSTPGFSWDSGMDSLLCNVLGLTLCTSILTRGVPVLGAHMVTVPLACPSRLTPL